MNWWAVIVSVALVGALGALARHAVSSLPSLRGRRPTGPIIAVNLVGAALAGFVAGVDHPLAWLVAAGIAGSLTTFSTVVVWMAEDMTNREPLRAVGLALWHVLGGIPVALAGFALSPGGVLPVFT